MERCQVKADKLLKVRDREMKMACHRRCVDKTVKMVKAVPEVEVSRHKEMAIQEDHKKEINQKRSHQTLTAQQKMIRTAKITRKQEILKAFSTSHDIIEKDRLR